MISTLENAYNKVVGQLEYNILLEMIKNVEERIFHDYPTIKKVDPMVANILNLETIKIRDEAERQKREAAKQASLSSIETMRKLGFIITEEQTQEILKHVME